MIQLGRVIIDADICINLSNYAAKNALRYVLTNIAHEVNIHEYVLETEILNAKCVNEIHQLINEGKIKVQTPPSDLKTIESKIYIETCNFLARAIGIDISKDRCEHKGEVVSVAMAKTLGIHVFMSNEWALQNEIDECINTGIDDVRIFRMVDIILWIKDNPGCGLSRKDALHIWLLSCKKIKFEQCKADFNCKLWPL